MNTKILDVEATSLRIRELLELNGLTAKDVQYLLNLASVQAVYKWTNPKILSVPSLDNLLMLANILNCTLDDILVTKEMEM